MSPTLRRVEAAQFMLVASPARRLLYLYFLGTVPPLRGGRLSLFYVCLVLCVYINIRYMGDTMNGPSGGVWLGVGRGWW